MRIDEAIKAKEKFALDYSSSMTPEEVRADKLSLEALKRVRDYKLANVGLHYTPMLGETEE